ncbi:MAG: DNA polymerase I [Spirulinaceae cyanobacterium]
MPDSTPKKLLLIDGHSLAFRAYYAFAKSRSGGLYTSSGIPTSVCFGFLNSLLHVMDTQQPQLVAVAFDLGGKTFRHEKDATYKADRKETPEDFSIDLGNLQELISALNLPIVFTPGYEADDVIAALAKQGSDLGYQVKIVSGDRDLFQLVDNQKDVSVLYLDPRAMKSASGIIEFGEEEVEEKMGIKPSQVVDYKALSGDKSDNIPGIRGIGDKTAVKLLREYETLAGVYENLDKLKGVQKKRLAEGKEIAYHSQYMAQLVYEVPGVELQAKEFQLTGFDTPRLQALLEELELKKFVKDISKLQDKFGGDSLLENAEETVEVIEDEELWFFSAEDTEKKQQVNQLQIQPQVIDTTEKLTALVEQLKTYQKISVAWDTETTALEPRDAELVGIGCCWGQELTEVAYIPTAHNSGTNLPKKEVLDALQPVLESTDYPKVLQNAKFDRLVFKAQGIELKGVIFDTMLASYILDPNASHKLGDLALKYLSGIEAKSYEDLDLPKGKTIADLDIPLVAEYCGLDAYSTFCLKPELEAKLANKPVLAELLTTIEQPLEPVLAEMEYVGIRIDKEYLEKFSQQLEQDLQRIEQQAYRAAGEEFNLASPKQLSEVLFEKLNLDTRKTRKTKTGYSTNHAVLEKLQGDHELIDLILEQRSLAKLKSTYVDTLPALIRPDTNRVHTNFNQTVTTTGRLSSSHPNLQNIPIRTAFSRQIRQAFIPKEGWLLVAADYSQIELRILAHLSQEPTLVAAYQEQKDVHTVTAQIIFEKEAITPEERRLGKIINFGVIYGMGAQRFARESGLTSQVGKDFIERYKERYALIFDYLENKKKEAIAQGFVTTIFNRRRYFNFTSDRLRKLKGSDPQDIDLNKVKNVGQYDAQLLRAAANSPIQGSSADIIKIAMIKLQKILANYQAKLLLQVHDELILEIPPEEWPDLQNQIKTTMENAVELSVPLLVEINSGKNWMEAK